MSKQEFLEEVLSLYEPKLHPILEGVVDRVLQFAHEQTMVEVKQPDSTTTWDGGTEIDSYNDCRQDIEDKWQALLAPQPAKKCNPSLLTTECPAHALEGLSEQKPVGKKLDENGFPRRARIDLHTPAEAAIRNALIEVEKIGAHVWLTKAVTLLGEAQEKVADYLESAGDAVLLKPLNELSGEAGQPPEQQKPVGECGCEDHRAYPMRPLTKEEYNHLHPKADVGHKEKLIRECADDLWNNAKRMTHNRIDERLRTLVADLIKEMGV